MRSPYTPTDRQAIALQPSAFRTRSVVAGYFASLSAGRRGLVNNSPPQFGQVFLRSVSAQTRQNVHSNEQMSASADSGGRSRLQHSQLGRS